MVDSFRFNLSGSEVVIYCEVVGFNGKEDCFEELILSNESYFFEVNIIF